MRALMLAAFAALGLPCAASAGDFDGPYAGVNLQFRDAKEDFYQRYWWDTDVNEFKLNQPAFGAFVGYNHQFGDFILGVELSSSSDLYGREMFSDSYEYNRTIPYTESWMWAGSPVNPGSGTRYENTGERIIGSVSRTTVAMKEAISPTLSGRVGVVVDDFLFYGRAGVGVSSVKISNVYRNAHTVCADTVSRIDFTPYTSQSEIIECIDPSIRHSSYKYGNNKLAATYTAAIGVEYNIDRFFTRIEAEARRINWGDDFLFGGDDGTTRYQVSFGLGVRF